MAGVPVGSTAPDHDLDDAEQDDYDDDDDEDDDYDDNDRHGHEEGQWELCQSSVSGGDLDV